MKTSTIFLTSILVIGLLYSIYRLFNGHGGSGLEDSFEALVYTSIFLFISSLIIILPNVRNFRKNLAAFVFLLLGLPMTLIATLGLIQRINYNRPVDLSPKYARPVNDIQYKSDSINIKVAIDSLIVLRNRETGGTKVLSSFIDTIIYSQTGDKVFISYIKKYAVNDLGNDLDPSYLFGETRNGNSWDLEETKYNMSGSYHDTISLKNAVRHFYFKKFQFLDKDSSNEMFFWKRIMHPGD
ncbi:MAG: hypothetical protein IPP48_07685 [Chitinophagaceae bacterium]|nr:hypothetical protein [Chitinophagaceae bacterium]